MALDDTIDPDNTTSRDDDLDMDDTRTDTTGLDDETMFDEDDTV